VNQNMFQNIGRTEVIVIAIVILVLFGGKKVPEFIRGVAEAIREFKRVKKKQ